jgi:hypothetical protein
MAPASDAAPFRPEAPAAGLPSRNTSLIAWSLLALILLAGLAGLAVRMLVAERAASLEAARRARMEAIALGRAEVLASWLDGLAAAGRRLTESELVRLFASEMALRPPGAPLDPGLAEQLPYFQQLDTSIYRVFGEVEVAGWPRGGRGRRLRLVSVVRWPALVGELSDRHASAGRRSSQSRRRMLWTRLASPILVVARARPMVRTNSPIRAFCSAKTCSM